MPTPITTWFTAANNAPHIFVVEDIFVRGGYRLVASATVRDAIHINHKKPGMMVFTQDDRKTWILNADRVTWTEVNVKLYVAGEGIKIDPSTLEISLVPATETTLGGIKLGDGLTSTADGTVSVIGGGTGGGGGSFVRETQQYSSGLIDAGGFENFMINMGKTTTILNLTVNQGYCQLQAFSTTARNDTNPYTFVAVPTHLTDDGTTTLTDGTVIKGRRYTILSNLEDPVRDKIYWTITNTGTVSQQYIIDITYIRME